VKTHPPLKLLIAASEAIPYAKTGGLADVAGALPQEFAKMGQDVILLIPAYQCLRNSGRTFREVARVPVHTFQESSQAIIEEDVVTAGPSGTVLRVWAVRHDGYFGRPGLYQENGTDYPDNLQRFVWFCRAIVEVIVYLRRERDWATDLLHLHDWQTALCAVYLKTIDRNRQELQEVRTLLTLHNAGYQGIFPGDQFHRTGLPSGLFGMQGLEFFGSVNLLKGGVIFSDFLTTVSPTYAGEILTPAFGFGLEGVLQNRKGQLQGIVNGIDTETWNPATDPFLPARYTVQDRRGKAVCKVSLQREFALPQVDVPLLAVIARLTAQKGIDLLESIIPQLMRMDLQLVMLGVGDPALEVRLKTLQAHYSDRMGVRIGFDEELAHRIEGGADIFVMPSRYEPCGLSQLYSLRYGTVPVVTKTGGLADTVVPLNVQTRDADRATGFHVLEGTEEALLQALRQAADVYQNRTLWDRLVQRGMKEDVSWQRSAQAYLELFERLVLESGAKSEGD